MAKRKRSRTQQGYMGMTLAQGMRLEIDKKQDYLNSKKYLSNFPAEDEEMRMPLNRAMRRLANRMKIELKEAK
ncbi:hypothetical protein ACNFJN_08175 [Xenorhabdus budapestensis]|uniref:Phage protein n=1 Tax=Xenorhabdus budapestensis TaxID=290110 RepID=A0ABX7VJI6_XENBU|nr:hypothetical protein [Xenorhabdus budapestensis]QTL40949.1 hypothetical protein HGO23_06305 [Xenorhabdus budapestensis]